MFLYLSIVAKEDLLYNPVESAENLTDGNYRFIDFETLKANIGESRAFKSNSQFFDRLEYAGKGVDFVNAYIDINTIVLIETEVTNYYTLKIINNNPNEKKNVFYNIVFEQNLESEEVTSEILHYNPNIEWLFDKSQPFRGEILRFDNQIISIDELMNSFDATLPKGINPCTISAELVWVCTVNNHPPGVEGCGGGWMWVLTIGPGCGNGGGGGGGNGGGYDPGDGGGGSSNSSGSTQTVTLEICNGYTNTGEPGDSEDCEDQYADYFTPYICEDYVDIFFINNWALNNQQAAAELANYLNNNFPVDDEDNCAEIDFEHLVILDREFIDNNCLFNVYEDMGKAPTFNNYLKNFEGTMSVANLRFSSSTSLPSSINATTSAPENYMITITFNENNLDRPSLSVARTMIHEMIHAEIFRKLLSVAQHPSIQLTHNQLIQLRNDYPGLYDYYMRWKWNVPKGQSPSNAQHQAMAQHYRDIISQAIMEYDNNQHSQDIYDALTWVGLMNTIAWNNLSLSEKNQIIQTINNFENNNPNCQ